MSESLTVQVAVWLRPDPRAPSVARRFITTACEASGVHPDICATAALLVSELVTNAIVHAGTDVQMQMQPTEWRLRVEVSDADPANPPRMLPVDPTTARGRGLRLVEALAARWGLHTAPARKTVWFELDLRPSSDATASVARSVASPVCGRVGYVPRGSRVSSGSGQPTSTPVEANAVTGCDL